MPRFICACCVAQIIVLGADPRRAHAELPGQIVATVDDDVDGVAGRSFIVIDPNTGTWKRDQRIRPRSDTRLSPDGRTVAYLDGPGVIRLMDLRTPGRTRLLKKWDYDGSCKAIWGSDSRELIAGTDDPRVGMWRVSVDGKKQQLLTIPRWHAVHDWSPDKKTIITVWRGKPSRFTTPKQAIYSMRLDGSQQRIIVGDGYYGRPRLSPDGKKVIYKKMLDGTNELWVVDVDGKNKKRVREGEGGEYPHSACWSPDGKHLAVKLIKRGQRVGAGRRWLEIMDANGKNRRKIDPGDRLKVGTPDWQAKRATARKKR